MRHLVHTYMEGTRAGASATSTIRRAAVTAQSGATEEAIFDTSTNMWSTNGIIKFNHIGVSPKHIVAFRATGLTLFKPVPVTTNEMLRTIATSSPTPIVFAFKSKLSTPSLMVFLFCMAAVAATYRWRRHADRGS